MNWQTKGDVHMHTCAHTHTSIHTHMHKTKREINPLFALFYFSCGI